MNPTIVHDCGNSDRCFCGADRPARSHARPAWADDLDRAHSGPVAHEVTVAACPSNATPGGYLVSSWDETAEDGPWNTTELPPRFRHRALGEADRRELAVLLHLARTQPDRRVSVLAVSREATDAFRADAGLPDSVVYTVETRLA